MLVFTLTNLDEFFSDNESRNVDTLIEVTKKFFGFVSALAEIVDALETKYAELDNKISLLSQQQRTSAPPTMTPSVSAAPPTPQVAATPSPPSATSTSLPTPPGLPTPPSAPVQAQSASPPPASALAAPNQQSLAPPSGLPPLPGQTPAPSLAPPPASGGQLGGPQTPGQPPRPSPMSLKAQMNMELKEAFSRIRKGWDDE